jgi:hypothetical protein
VNRGKGPVALASGVMLDEIKAKTKAEFKVESIGSGL